MRKRILWLMNETAIRDAEVPMLLDNGYGVFCPKVCSMGMGASRFSVTWKYDDSLDLPGEVLSILNSTDFYSSPISSDILDLLDQYFDIAFILPEKYLLRALLQEFGGQIILRALGNREGMSCTEQLVRSCGYEILTMIRAHRSHFWLACASRSMINKECDLLRGRAMFMPMLVEQLQVSPRKHGAPLLLCPNIRVDGSAKAAYDEFTAHWHDEYVLLGDQLVPFETAEYVEPTDGLAYEQALSSASAAFYPFTKNTDVNMPYVDALQRGVPLVYLSGSAVHELLGGNKRASGCAKNIDEAIRKMRQLANDRNRALLARQQADCLKKENKNHRKAIKEALRRIEISIGEQEKTPLRKKRVCLLMLHPDNDALMAYAMWLLEALIKGVSTNKAPVELVFACIDGAGIEDLMESVRAKGVNTRLCHFEVCNEQKQRGILDMLGYLPRGMSDLMLSQEKMLINDGMNYLFDCDFIINISALNNSSECFLLSPHALIIHGFGWRYGNTDADVCKIKEGRTADHVFAIDKFVEQDTLQYALCDRNIVSTIPFIYEPPAGPDLQEAEKKIAKESYFMWRYDENEFPSVAENALKVLDYYYRNGGSMHCLIVLACDSSTYLQPGTIDTLKKKVKESIRQYPMAKKYIKLKIAGSRKQMLAFVLNAAFYFNPGFAGNGNYAVLDAVSLGVPVFSQETPSLQWQNEAYRANIHFSEMKSSGKAAEALMEMQRNHRQYAEQLPPRRMMESRSVEKMWESVYREVAGAIGFSREVLA